MKYKDYNDSELIYLINDGNEEAYNLLYEKYGGLIHKAAGKYTICAKNIGLDYNDLVQEGMIGFAEAISSYKDINDTKFSTFATICIKNQLYSILKAYSRQKNSALNESLSLDYIKEEGEKLFIDNVIDNSEDPSVKLETKENMSEIYEKVYKELSKFEQQVFELKVADFDYNEIAILLNKSYKSVATAMERIKLKLKKIYK